ncbi:hypothetical protein HZA42_02590 [Candidatus Peregrinibacteria bacterium]|nr:hypothetical protein [Candidatus Peregrinibacteria bacterium]
MKKYILLFVLALGFTGCVLNNDQQNSKLTQTPSPTVPATSTASSPVTFENTFKTGFEGYNSEVTYKLSYVSPDFEVATAGDGQQILLKEKGITNTVEFFNNEGLGAGSADELWRAAYANKCPDCKKAATTFQFQNLPDANPTKYENATDEWIIGKISEKNFGFVVADLKKPAENAEKILHTLSASISKTTPDIVK